MNIELMNQIMQLSRELAQAEDVDQLLTMALDQTIEVVGAERSYLILVNADGELDFRIRSTVSEIDGENIGESAISRSIFDQVIKSGKPLVLTDALSDHNFVATSIIELQIRSIMCVPLISRGNILGALYVENRAVSGAFFEEDLEPLVLFANQIAVTIENVLIIANLEERVAVRTAEVQKGWQEAMEANRLRTIFLSQLVHDLRNPATVIQMSLDMLNKSSLNDRQKRNVSRASLSLDQMVKLIEDVFELSKNELRVSELDTEPIDLTFFLIQIFEVGRGLPRQDGVEFRHEIPKSLPVVTIDPIRIQQVIMNLITNALKFTAKGEVVLYALADESQFVHIGVSDTGMGIPKGDESKIFERFYQGEMENHYRSKGSGLGLAISRELVERHGGQIWLDSNDVDQGSNFRFTLPLKENRDK